MLRLCSAFSDRPIQTFLSGSRDDERLFDLLMKSYSGSRYRTGYSVTQQEAQSLFERTSLFLNLVKDMCEAKIESLKNEATFHNKLIGESEVKVA